MGLANRLLTKLLENLAEVGVEELLLEVEENNESALGLSRSHGFVLVGQRPNYYESPTGNKLSALIMKRIIA